MRLTMFGRAAALVVASMLLMTFSGCGPTATKAVVAAPRAPVQPEEVKPGTIPAVKFVDITKEAGIQFRHFNGAFGDKLLPETMGAGVAFIDYDNDGDQDLFFVNSSYWPGHEVKPTPTQALYRNDGKGHFEDVSKAAGLDKTFYGQGVAVGDYDNDGDPDLYVTAIGGGHLFRNDGKGHFDDVTESVNAHGPNGWLSGAAFLDIENDGDLDLFVASYITWSPEIDKVQGFQLTGLGRAYGPPSSFSGSFCTLLRNDGGHFVDISDSSGVQVRTPDLRVPIGKSLGVAPYDVDGDGLVDIAVANDTVQNFLFHNKGGGKFEEVAITSGVAFDQSGSPRGGMGIDWAPFLNDERLGLAVGNFANEMTALYVCDQPSMLQFSDLANLYGLGAPNAAAAEVRVVLLRLRPRRPPRPDLGQRPPRARNLQGAGQRALRAVRAALLELGQARPIAVRAGQARTGRARPVPADRGSRLRLRRHRRRRRPRCRRHRQ